MEHACGLSITLAPFAQARSDVVDVLAGHFPAGQDHARRCIFDPQEHGCAAFHGAVKQPSRVALLGEVASNQASRLPVQMAQVEEELSLLIPERADGDIDRYGAPRQILANLVQTLAVQKTLDSHVGDQIEPVT